MIKNKIIKTGIAFGAILFVVSCTSNENKVVKDDSALRADSIAHMKDRIKTIIEKYPNAEHDYYVSFDNKNIIIKTIATVISTSTEIDTIPINLLKISITEEYERVDWVVIRGDSIKSNLIERPAFNYINNVNLIFNKSIGDKKNTLCNDLNSLASM